MGMHKNCLMCGSDAIHPVLTRAAVPVFQNAIYRNESTARAAATGDLALAVCGNCSFVFNAPFDPARIAYGPEYENDQSHSDIFLRHMDAMADRVLAALPPQGGTVVEVGCGQGGFLGHLMRRGGSHRLLLHGFDPTYRGGALPPGISISSRLFDRTTMSEIATDADVIVSRHVIEHVPNACEFLLTIRDALGAKRHLQVFVETPCFDWIAANRVMQDVFYEHVNYFTAATLARALNSAGFEVGGVEHVFGGQYLWAAAVPADQLVRRDADADAGDAIGMARQYASRVEQQVMNWSHQLADRVPTALWGAGAKGVTFAGLVDPDRSRIACLIDLNPNKQRKFVPVMAHPIVSPQEAERRGVRRILVMNPNYMAEIRDQVASQGWPVALVQAGATV
jgi:hypothetical protein